MRAGTTFVVKRTLRHPCSSRGISKTSIVFYADHLPFHFGPSCPRIRALGVLDLCASAMMDQPGPMEGDINRSILHKLPFQVVNRNKPKGVGRRLGTGYSGSTADPDRQSLQAHRNNFPVSAFATAMRRPGDQSDTVHVTP